MTGYQDYLIILSPPEDVSEQVKRLKYSSSAVIGEYEGLFSKAHITIQPWMRKKPVWVGPLIPKLERDLQNLPTITLTIDGFDFFDHQEGEQSAVDDGDRQKIHHGQIRADDR